MYNTIKDDFQKNLPYGTVGSYDKKFYFLYV